MVGGKVGKPCTRSHSLHLPFPKFIINCPNPWGSLMDSVLPIGRVVPTRRNHLSYKSFIGLGCLIQCVGLEVGSWRFGSHRYPNTTGCIPLSNTGAQNYFISFSMVAPSNVFFMRSILLECFIPGDCCALGQLITKRA